MTQQQQYKDLIDEKGFAVIPLEESPFSESFVNEILEHTHPEKVTYSLSLRGDTEESAYANYYRIRYPGLPDSPLIYFVDELEKPEIRHFVESISGQKGYEIDRCQTLLYGPQGFVSTHVDAEHYDGYSHTAILMLEPCEKGGEISLLDKNKNVHDLELNKGDFLLFDAWCPHQVKPVVSGFRKSFIFFLKVK